MAKTPSTMLPLGTPAPEFNLPNFNNNVAAQELDLAQIPAAKPLLVMFLCNHCPFVKHVAPELAKLGRDYQAKGVEVIAISSNDVDNYPDDRPELMTAEAAQWGYTFPYLFDESQAVAKAYQAACTPDFYLFNKERQLVYRGQLDASRPGNDLPVTGEDLRRALDETIATGAVSGEQRPSLGCNIKWKPGSAPAYFGA